MIPALMLGWAFAGKPIAVVRGPYLQMGTPHSIVIRWRTDAATDSRVVYGTNLGSLNLSQTLLGSTKDHEVRLFGLAADTRYYYACGDRSEIHAPAGTNQYFATAPPYGTPKSTRIWVIGDAGASTSGQVAVRDAFYAVNGTNHTDLWLQLGDIGGWSGTDSEFQSALFGIYPSLLENTVTWPTLGNHDTAESTEYTTNYPYFGIFTLPTAGEAGGVPSGTEHYYSFDYANIHLVCLNSMTLSRAPTGAMALWLETDLHANTNTWLIAFWHHSPYSKGSHDSDTEIELLEMRENLLPILEAHGVDLVLSANSHSYERSWLLDSHYESSATLTPAMILDHGNGREGESGAYRKPRGCGLPHQGAVHAVVGCSSEVRGGLLNHPAMCVSSNVLGSMLVEICGNRLDAVFLNGRAEINDAFTIMKMNYAPLATNLPFIIDADSPAELGLTASDINRDAIQFRQLSAPAHGLLSGFAPQTGRFTYWPAHGFRMTDVFEFQATDGELTGTSAAVIITIRPPADTNSNGLPDIWEWRYGVTNPGADADHDGMSNLHEYLACTDPLNPQSSLRIIRITRRLEGGFSLTWSSAGGVRYRVAYADNPSPGNLSWASVVRPVVLEMDPSPPGTASTMTFIDDFSLTTHPGAGPRYYRIEVVR